MKSFLSFLIVGLLGVSSSMAQNYFLTYNHPLHREIRAGASFAAGNVTIWPYNSTVRVQVMVDTIGVWPGDSVKIAFNYDTTSTNVKKLRPSQMTGVPWDSYGPEALAPVHSIQIWGTSRFPVTIDIE